MRLVTEIFVKIQVDNEDFRTVPTLFVTAGIEIDQDLVWVGIDYINTARISHNQTFLDLEEPPYNQVRFISQLKVIKMIMHIFFH